MSREILHVFKIMLIYIKILQSDSKVTSKFHFDQILCFFFAVGHGKRSHRKSQLISFSELSF